MGGTLDDVTNNSILGKELLNQFKLVEKLPSEKKIVIELMEAFLIKTELQKRLAH